VNTESFRRARNLLAHREIVFFEVWVQDDEDPVEIAAGLAKLHCATHIDHARGVIRTFAPNRKPADLVLG
jgi:hypothetical protein